MAHNREKEQNSADLFFSFSFLKTMSDSVIWKGQYYDNYFTNFKFSNHP